jgi:hypothetical protein
MSVTNDMQNARQILKTEGLRHCAKQICEAFSLTTAADLANLKDAEIDAQTFIIFTEAEAAILKLICEQCRRAEKHKKVHSWITRPRHSIRKNSDILDLLDDIESFWVIYIPNMLDVQNYFSDPKTDALRQCILLQRKIQEDPRANPDAWRTTQSVHRLQEIQKYMRIAFDGYIAERDQRRLDKRDPLFVSPHDRHYDQIMKNSDRDKAEYQALDDRLTVMYTHLMNDLTSQGQRHSTMRTHLDDQTVVALRELLMRLECG